MNPNIQNLQQLKQWLKDTASQIRKVHTDLKEYQRQNGGSMGTYIYAIQRLRYEYRHHHIAYCEIRGVERDAIEKPKDKHLPNEAYIKQIKDDVLQAMAIPEASIAQIV
ncbi:MAG: hypothetical protein WC375_05620 [Methanomassiliicoccales archaeon]|jgi:hypothetical protein